MTFPYSYDHVVEAICSTRGDGAHFVLTSYLQLHRDEVGLERFRTLLETANLGTQDQMGIDVSMAQIDPTYIAELPAVLETARTIEAQQVLLAGLPDLLPRERQEVLADALEAWLRRRVKRASYLENGASWEIPSALLAVLYSTDVSRARALLADLEPHLDERGRPFAQTAHESSNEAFEAILKAWLRIDGFPKHEPSSSEIAESSAETEREAAKYMRRLGFQPAN